jgi:ribosomal protein S11
VKQSPGPQQALLDFKGAKKGTPFAAQIAAEKASKEAIGSRS